MKYAHEILGLMRPYPGTEFRMAQLVREATRGRTLAPRKGVRRVLDHLIESGQVDRIGGDTKSAAYTWRGLGHEVCKNTGILGRSVGQYDRATAP